MPCLNWHTHLNFQSVTDSEGKAGKIAFKKTFIQAKSLGIMSGIIFFRVTLIFYNIMVLPSSGLTVLNNLLSEGTNTSARMEEFTQKGRSISPLFNIEQRWLIYWPFIPSITKMYITCILHVLCEWPLRAWQTCWKQVACQTGGWKPPLLVL